MAAVAVRQDIAASELRRLARLESDGRVASRLLAIAAVLDGLSRQKAAESAGMDRQSLRDWMHRFMPKGWPGCGIGPAAGGRLLADDLRPERARVTAVRIGMDSSCCVNSSDGSRAPCAAI